MTLGASKNPREDPNHSPQYCQRHHQHHPHHYRHHLQIEITPPQERSCSFKRYLSNIDDVSLAELPYINQH